MDYPRNSLYYGFHVVILHAVIHWQRQDLGVGLFSHRAKAYAGAEALSVEWMEVYGNIMYVRADAF
jgi:hypothetical protein